MNRNKLVLGLFAFLALLQLAAPLYLVWQWEDIRNTGHVYQWKTAPVDPYDALRGRYVDLQFKEMKGPVIEGEQLTYGQKAYALIASDDNGYAYISSVSAKKPQKGDYVSVRVNYTNGGMVNITLPFKRYYMREDLAPEAEQAYRKSAGKDGRVTVRIKNGLGVVEQLYVGNQTINEYLRGGSEK
jgi:uncharacterized membrane-anchored protein